MNVFVTARDKKNGIITDLKQDDFKIYEDGVEQKVAFFSKDMNLPITLAILIDTSGSMQNILGAEQDAASRFVKTVMRKKDEALVISFDFDVNLLADFTEDPAVLERGIHRATISAVSSGGVVTPGTVPQGQNGGTDLYDAVYLACHDELATEAGRKAVVVLSDAEDTGSKVSLKESIEAAQRSDAVIHFLRLSDEPFYFQMGMSYSGASVARQMADETGGREVEIKSEKNLEARLRPDFRRAALAVRARLLSLEHEARRNVPQDQGRSQPPRHKDSGPQRLLRPGKIAARSKLLD